MCFSVFGVKETFCTIEDYDLGNVKVNKVDKVESVNTVNKLVNQSVLSVFGTEYQVYDDARIFLQLLEGGVVVDDASCLINVFYPDTNSFFVDAPMVYLVNGLYFYDFHISNLTGIYMLDVNCYYKTETFNFVANNFSLLSGGYMNGLLSDSFVSDNNDLKFDVVDNDLFLEFEFLNNASGLNGSINLFFEGRLMKVKKSDFGLLKFSIFNFNLSEWVYFDNSLLAQSSGNDQFANSHLDVLSVDDFIGGGVSKVRLEVVNGSGLSFLDIDFLSLSFEVLVGESVNDIRGGGEVHVSSYAHGLSVLLSDLSVDLNYNFSSVLVGDISYSLISNLNNFSFNEPSIIVHGTEYKPFDDVKVWLQLLNGSNVEIVDAVCAVSVYDPFNNIFIDDATMINLFDNGIFYYDFVAPVVEGVYPVVAECFYSASQSFELADSFSYVYAKDFEGDYSYTHVLDGDEHKFKEVDVGGVNRLDVSYSFNDMCGLNVSEDFLMGLSIFFNGKWDSIVGDDLTFYLFNFSSGEWFELPNKVFEPNNRVSVSNFVSVNNLSSSGLVNSSGSLILRFNDSNVVDNDDSKLEVDYLSVSCDSYSGGVFESLKGSSEVHISSTVDYNNNFSDVFDSFESLEFFIELKHNNSDVLVSSLNDSLMSFIDFEFEVLNNSLFYEFDLFNDLLLSVYNNLSFEIQNIPVVDYNNNFSDVLSAINIVSGELSVHDVDIKDLIGDLDSVCNNNFNFLNDKIIDLEFKIDLILEKLNIVTSKINLEALTHDCLEGSTWSIEVVATDNFANYLNFEDISCDITTNLWGVNELIWVVDSFDFSHECGYGNDTINWVVDCEEI